jgi:hypothetical protein
MTDEDDLSDAGEFVDYILHVVAAAIQGASSDFPDAARSDFPPETDGRTTLAEYLRSNKVSDHLAGAVFENLGKHRLQIRWIPDA